MVLTQKSREGKLERVDFHRKGKDHAEDPANLYERISGRSRPAYEIESEAVSANCTRSGYCAQYAASWVSAVLGAGRAGISWEWTSTPQEEEIRHLKRENDLRRQERDILKKAIGIFSRGQ